MSDITHVLARIESGDPAATEQLLPLVYNELRRVAAAKLAHEKPGQTQKGVIHRDIEPSNVLVTLHDGTPVPKVIDFGVAKALNARLTDRTIYTEHLQVVGTLLYMSPEQAELSGLDVDTRSDVYSLGVVLYE